MSSSLPQGGVRYFRKYLFDSPILEADFSRGIIRDVPRWMIPAGGVYRAEDVVITSPGVVQGRGGSVTATSLIPVAASTNPTTVGVLCPNYTTGQKVIALSSDGASTTYANDVSTGTPGSAINLGTHAPSENPPFGEDMAIITDQTGVAIPKTLKASGGVLAGADLGGTPPIAKVSCVWNAFLVLANNPTNPNRMWFSAPSNFEGTWDTTNSWVDVDRPIMGLATVSGNLIVFTRNTVSRVLGSEPPDSTSAGNLGLQPLANIGCIDARTIVMINDNCYFANEDGVYVTNGTTVESLTTKNDNTGISSLWTATLSAFSPALGAVVSAGQWQNKFYIISVIHNNGTKTMFICYLPSQSWTQVTNHNGTMFAFQNAPSEQLFMSTLSGGDATHSMLLNVSHFFQQSTTVSDFNNVSVKPLIETRTLIAGSPGLKRFGFGHVTYKLPNASDVLTIQHALGLDDTLTFGSMDEGTTQGQATGPTRARFTINRDTQGLTFRFQQTTTNDIFNLYDVEIEAADYFIADGQ